MYVIIISSFSPLFLFLFEKRIPNGVIFIQENPDRANGHIFNVGNPNNEVTVRQLAEMMTAVRNCSCIFVYVNDYSDTFFSAS